MPDLEPKPDAWLQSHLDKNDITSPLFRPLLRGLQRLNQLPRSDPFWRLTNLEPTVHKLTEFCELALRQNPEDDEVRAEDVRPLIEALLPGLEEPILSHARRFLAGEIPW